MKLVCRYGNIVEEGSYWCRICDRECPPNTLSLLFEHGEQIEEIRILQLVHVYQKSALYAAERNGERLFLKIAHQGHEDALRHEALTLASVENHPSLPILRSASAQEQRPYGKITIRNQVKYFLLFEYQEGELLCDILERNTQLPTNYAAWLTIALADILAYMSIRYKKLITVLEPAMIQVRVDKLGVPRPLLLDLGFLLELGGIANPGDYIVSGYQAPEYVMSKPSLMQTDVYVLGVLLYEMLAGHAVFENKQQTTEQLRNSIINAEPIPIKQKRPELVIGVSDIVHKALAKNPEDRQQNVRVFAKGLRTLFGEVPPEPRSFHYRRNILAGIVLLLLTGLVVLLTVMLVNY